MKTSIIFENKLTMIAQMENDSIFQVLEYNKLSGVTNFESAIAIDALNKTNTKLRQPRIILDNSKVIIEPGAISYMKGNIDKVISGNRAINIGKKILNNKFKQQDIEDEKPILGGAGEIFLEPSFSNYVLIELEDEEVIVSDNIFLACEDTIVVKDRIEGAICETILSGSGIVLLELSVPEEEIFKCKLYNDTIKADGDLVVLRGGKVNHEVESYTSVTGNGLMNVYSGIGDVWILPTKNIYKDIKDYEGINEYYDE